MPFLLQPWDILLAALCGMVNERQQQIIEFQNAQIEALLKKLGKKRLLLDDNQRRLLAVKAHAIGRTALLELTTIFTPDTILRWHRELVAKKFDSSDKRKPGRPRIRQGIVDAIVCFATENPTWGYDRIQGALKNVGYHIADSTVANVLKAPCFVSNQRVKRRGVVTRTNRRKPFEFPRIGRRA
ncbi:MAG: helix-turn-helix domain-containing protein [Pirellulaceae bacterium]